jgi:predicted phosphodiesterase
MLTEEVTQPQMETSTQEVHVTPSPLPSPTLDVFEDLLPLGKASYVLPLTILHVTEHTATLFFELDTPASGSVFVRNVENTSPIIEKPLSPGQVRHQLSFEGLEPGNRYEVLVALEDGAGGFQQPGFLSRVWGSVSFHTIAAKGELRFGVIGDASFGDSLTEALLQQMMTYDLDFILHCGDVVDETEWGMDPFESYAMKYYKTFEPILTRMPVYKVPGNHDYDEDIRWQGEPFYYYAFPPFATPNFPHQADNTRNQYYAFEQRGIQFMMLDSQVLFGASGREEQDHWLSERLMDPNFLITIPVFHVSPFSSSSVHPTDSLPVRRVWVPMFEEAKVPLVFSGHFHQYERLFSQGVTYIVSGGGSSVTYAPGPFIAESQVFARKTHFVLVEVDGTALRLTAIALGGEIIDQVELSLDEF